jgi:hypothetical protein
MQVDDLALGSNGRRANADGDKTNSYESPESKETSEHHVSSQLRQVELRGPRKANGVDEHAAGERPTSTRCRFCGFEEGPDDARSVREKPHFQVVVACGSCGHPFAVLSRN